MTSVVSPPFQIEPRLRRTLSASFALSLVAGVVAAQVSMLQGWMERREEIESLKTEIGRLIARTAVASGAGQALGSPETGDTAGFFAPDAEAAAAHLQTMLRSLSATLGSTEIRVDGVRVLPALPEGATTAVRVSASLSVPATRIFDTLNALEAAAPPIVIDSLRILSRDAGGTRGRSVPGMEVMRGELTLVLRVYARSGSAVPGASTSRGGPAARERGLQ